MRTAKLCLAMLVTATMAIPVLTQGPAETPSADKNNFVQFYNYVPKPGMTVQFEAGLKKHMAWHAAQRDPWSWRVWEVITGDNTGAYVVGSFHHKWQDFDRENFGDAEADATVNLSPYLSSSRMAFWTLRPDPSFTTEDFNTPYLSLIHYLIDPTGVITFSDNTEKMLDAMRKTNYPIRPFQWYSLVNGGDTIHYVQVTGLRSFADMVHPDKDIVPMLKEVYGDEGPKLVYDRNKTYHHTWTEMLKYRPDLSYNAK
jgi:hypothetical protein